MKQKSLSAKRERRYVHIKEGLFESGRPEAGAEETAVHVVGESLSGEKHELI